MKKGIFFLLIALLIPLARQTIFCMGDPRVKKIQDKHMTEREVLERKIKELKEERETLDPESQLAIRLGLLIIVMQDLKDLNPKIEQEEIKLTNAPEELKNYNILRGMVNLTVPRVLLQGTYYPRRKKWEKMIVQLEAEIDQLRKQ